MTSATSLIGELEGALSTGTDSNRAEMLFRITDLFIAGADRYSANQIHLFDELIARLVAAIETSARVKLADRLAPLANAPTGVVRMLAFDDNILVARPVLRRSDRLDEVDLVANASSKSQQHLVAISERRFLSEAVTDVLVTRGDHAVVHSVAMNAGARFSFAGFRMLVRRSVDDDALAIKVGTRSDLPRQHMQRLLEQASETVRARLLTENPGSAGAIDTVVREVGDSIRGEIAAAATSYDAARAVVEPLHRGGQLDEAAICGFVRARKFEETVVALALLCEVAVEVVERALLSPGLEIRLILVKLAGLSWTAAKAVLQLKETDRELSSEDLDKALANFKRLNIATARRVLGFYHTRTKGLTGSTA